MFCEQCGKQIKDSSTFCGFCGSPVKIRPAVQETTQSGQPVQRTTMPEQQVQKTIPSVQAQKTMRSGQSEQKAVQFGRPVQKTTTIGQPVQVQAAVYNDMQMPQKKKGTRTKKVVIGGISGLVVGIAAALITVYVPPVRNLVWGTNSADESKEDQGDQENRGETTADVFSDESGASESGISENAASESDAAERTVLTAEETEELEEIDALVEQAEDYAALGEALEQYCDFASEHSASGSVEERGRNVYEDYQSRFFAHLEMLDGQQVSPALYLQITSDFEWALELAAKLADLGVIVDTAQIQEKYEAFPQNYKERYISTYSEEALQTWNENGVVSRSSLWSVMEGADQVDFYDHENPDDPFVRCYTAALSLKVDSELEALDDTQANAMVYEVMGAVDYNPLMIYYLAERGGDAAAIQWRDDVQAIMESHGYDFFSRDIIGMRNFVYEFSMDGSDQAVSCRREIREYMREHFPG